MPKGQPKDKKLVSLQREVREFERAVGQAKSNAERAFRERQLAKARTDLARYLQNKHPEK